MINCDCQENEDEITVATTANKKHISFEWTAHNHRSLHVCRTIFWPKGIRRRTTRCIINIYVIGIPYVFASNFLI